MIPQAEGGLAAADGSEELERLKQHNRDIRDGDAGDAISVRVSCRSDFFFSLTTMVYAAVRLMILFSSPVSEASAVRVIDY